MAMRTGLGEGYSPTYFLAALGNGGLAISFFIYLMFMLPYPEAPIPDFAAVTAGLTTAGPVSTVLVTLALAGVVWFSLQHVRMLVWNLREFQAFRTTPAYERLRASNAEVSLMTIPLTLAMSVNVGFVVGSLFVPGLWSVVEFLFPVALLAFGAVAVYAVRLFLDYFGRIIVDGRFDSTANNDLSQLIAIFALTMIGVGFAAPAAMSQVTLTSVVGMVLSIGFLSAATLFAMVKMVLGFRDMLQHGLRVEGAPSLWIMIPILTVGGIAMIRLSHGLHHHLDTGPSAGALFVPITILFSLQMVFGLLGLVVMRRLDYFGQYVRGDKMSPASYALICPGVAFFVFGQFFLHVGLVKTGLLAPFSLPYLVLLAPLVYVQFRTIETMVRLNRKHLRPVATSAQPVELHTS